MSLSETKAGLFTPQVEALARKIADLTGWRQAALSFTLGALSVLGFAPFHLWPVNFITLPFFIWLLDGIAFAGTTRTGAPKWRQAALAGWWFGFGFFTSGLYWVSFAFFVEAEKFAWLVPFGVAAFPAALAMFFALAGAAAMALWRPGAGRVLILAGLFFAADWLRGHLLTGFPWNLWGYAPAGNEALAQTASIFGIYGLTLFALIIFASPAALAGIGVAASRGRWALPAISAVLLLFAWAWGVVRVGAGTDDFVQNVQLRIVQANIPQADKWKPENRGWIFDRYLTLSQQQKNEADGGGKITHLIWPETSIPFLFMLNDKIYVDDVRRELAKLTADHKLLILGAERVEGTRRTDGRYAIDRVFNSLFVLDSTVQILDIYDKVHLVPFGEYIPFETALTALGIKQLTHMNTGFDKGESRRPIEAPDTPSFLPLICYESIFPSSIGKEAKRPAWLLNLTNDAWFGTSTGPYQHLHQSRLRAIEQGLPLIRAANTGVSAVIDGYGRVLAQLPLNQMGVIDHPLPVALEPTHYAKWGEIWLILLAFGIFVLYRIVIEVERL